LDPRYTNFRGQPGHFFETAVKLPQLREHFPGKIDGYLAYREFSDFPGNLAPGVTNNFFLDYVCQVLKLPFKDTGYKAPPVYFLKNLIPVDGELLCFQEILVSRITSLYYSSRNEADNLRSSGIEPTAL
jgi:hypothetical protein